MLWCSFYIVIRRYCKQYSIWDTIRSTVVIGVNIFQMNQCLKCIQRFYLDLLVKYKA